MRNFTATIPAVARGRRFTAQWQGALIASNNNWQQTIIGGIITQDQVQDIQNGGHTPADASESAIIATLPPGNYTAIVRGVK